MRILIHPVEIKVERQRAKLSQKQLADEVEISQPYISRLEVNSANPSAVILDKITEVLSKKGRVPTEVDTE